MFDDHGIPPILQVMAVIFIILTFILGVLTVKLFEKRLNAEFSSTPPALIQTATPEHILE